MAVNQQYSDPPFVSAGADAYLSTGAPGSPPSPGGSAGPVVGRPAVLGSFDSSQLPVSRVDVTSGDTCAFSDDVPVHDSPLLPGSPEPYMSTGAGDGRAEHIPHPNAAGR